MTAGVLYEVNELGREFFRPDVSGTVIPLGGEHASGPRLEAGAVQIDARGLSPSQAARFASEFVAFRTGLKVGV